jgi:hypothetical protein
MSKQWGNYFKQIYLKIGTKRLFFNYNYALMAQRNLAERALGLLPTSCGVGLIGSGATLL